MGEIFMMVGTDESFDSFPGIAAHVTAYGRMYLWKLMNIVGRYHYFYCDTDSLIIDGTGLARLKKLISQAGLGGLKIEETCSHVLIRGLKDYTTTKKTVTKGIRKNAVQIADGVYQQELWPGFRGLLRSGDAETYTVKTVTKHLTREYKKGTVKPDGSVVPLLYDDSPILF
jgi:hypothetical protein